MQKVGIIFVGAHNMIGQFVQEVTDSQWAHVGIFMPSFGGIVEALFPKVIVSPVEKYNWSRTETIELVVSDEQYILMESMANQILGKHYGFDDCIIGGIHDTLGDNVSDYISPIIDYSGSIDCSATVAAILRAGMLDLFPGEFIAEITPQAIYAALNNFLCSN